uniref:Uncharacterized protein n=1 Tax=Arundo donax TaxID=35708 RepID=A0A0A9ETW8_ARUDO
MATTTSSGTQRARYTVALTPSPISSYNLYSLGLVGNLLLSSACAMVQIREHHR